MVNVSTLPGLPLLLLLLVAAAEGGRDDVRAAGRELRHVGGVAEAGEAALAAEAGRAAARLGLLEHLGQLLHRLRGVLRGGRGRQRGRGRAVAGAGTGTARRAEGRLAGVAAAPLALRVLL